MSRTLPIFATATVRRMGPTASAELTSLGWSSVSVSALAVLNATADPRDFGPDMGDPMALACTRAAAIPGVTVDVLIEFDSTPADDGRKY